MKFLNSAAFACTLAAALSPFGVAPAIADTMAPHDAMPGHAMSADCSKADAMMAPHEMSGHMSGEHAMAGDHMMKATGDVDKDFASAMSAHMPGAMAMAKMEAKCGKNPAEMKAAADLVNALEAFDKQLDIIRHTP